MAGDGGADQAVTRRTIVALDSGAYSVSKLKKSKQSEAIDIDEYIEFATENQHLLEVIFNLDVIGDGEQSHQNWEYIRRKGLERVVPVWHDGTPIKYLETYIEEADYVAIGGIADQPVQRLDRSLKRLWKNHLVDRIGFPKARFHAFGITSHRLVAPFQWHSVDSSLWVKESGKYAKCLIPKRKKYESNCYSYKDPPTRVSVTTRSSDRKDHIDRLPARKRLWIVEYLENRGFKLGRGDRGSDDYMRGLRNDGTLRDQLNAIFYAEMGLALGKPVYLAGNFPALEDHEVEKQIQQAVFAIGSNYYRLISFNYEPKIQTVLDLKREELSHDR
jgi:hypothetical protein